MACTGGDDESSLIRSTPTFDPEIRGLTTTAIMHQQELDHNQTITAIALRRNETATAYSQQKTRESDQASTAIARELLRIRDRNATAAAIEQRRIDSLTATAYTNLIQNRTATARAVVLRQRRNATSTAEAVERARARVLTTTALAEERQRSEQATATAFAQRLQQTRDETATAIALLPTSTPTATPVRDPSGIGRQDLAELQQLALDLINEERRDAGVPEVVLDDNPTAQLHANRSRRDCINGGWGTDGLNIDIHYTLNGGADYASPIFHGADYCPDDPSNYVDRTLVQRLNRSNRGLVEDPRFLENIIDPVHRKVGIGISYSEPNLWFVQLFTTDFIKYEIFPSIRGTTLSYAYRLTNGATQRSNRLSAYLHYDPPARPLTRGQLARTYCSGSGLRVAGLRLPAEPGYHWTSETFETEVSTCPNPYDISPLARPPRSYDEASELHDQAEEQADAPATETAIAVWLAAERRTTRHGGIRVEADIYDILDQYGPGTYTLLIFANVDGESTPVSQYSIFVD